MTRDTENPNTEMRGAIRNPFMIILVIVLPVFIISVSFVLVMIATPPFPGIIYLPIAALLLYFYLSWSSEWVKKSRAQ